MRSLLFENRGVSATAERLKTLWRSVDPRNAVAAIERSVVRIRVHRRGISRIRRGIPPVADAMGPGVISADCNATCRAALNGEYEPVVICRATGVDAVHRTVILRSLFRYGTVQYQTAALVRVRRRRAGIVGHAVQCARPARNIDCRIDGLRAPQMAGFVSEVRHRCQPIRTDLPLDAEVPVGNHRVRTVIVHRRDDAGKRERHVAPDVAAVIDREWIAARIRCPRIVELHILTTIRGADGAALLSPTW